MDPQVEKALERADETRALIVGTDVLGQTAELFRTQFPDRKAIVVADTNTWTAAGEKVFQILEEAGIAQEKPFIFDADGLYAEWEYIEMLDENLKTHDAIPVACGSGTINDLCKLCAFHQNRRYMVCGTAASMDGYTAFGASITFEGKKQTFSCPAPQAALVDTRIAGAADLAMTASGYADLYAKVPAGADWILADSLGIEAIDGYVWDVVQDGLHDALSNPEGLAAKDPEAFAPLVEGLILSGFAMQASKSSRPASGAEHQFSHLWDMEHLKVNGVSPSHGSKVGIGTLCSLALYECLLETDVSRLDVDACVSAWPTLEAQQKTAAEMFAGTDFPDLGVTEVTAKYCTPEELRRQLETLKQNWPEIKAKLEKQLVPSREVYRKFALIGAPKDPEDVGVTRERLRGSFIRAQHIRRRFTILDLAVRMNCLETWLARIFSKGGLWEIRE